MNHFARRAATAAAIVMAGASPAMASFHLWTVKEVYSNADGTVQFIEWFTTFSAQNSTGGHAVTTDAGCFTFPNSLPPGSTANQHFLMATAAFDALPNSPTPDYVMPDGFVDITGDTIRLRTTCASGTQHTFIFGAGALPTDGCLSLNANLTTGTNSPTNFAGTTGSIDLCVPPCPSDTNGDGAVDVDDQINVILDWGTDGSAHNGNVNGQGVVDVDDLVQVVLDWGNCPA